MANTVGLIGLSVMGQNLALNIAEKGYQIAVWNRTAQKVTETVSIAEKEGLSSLLKGYEDLKNFVESIRRPRAVFLIIKAGNPVDQMLKRLVPLLEAEDIVIDCGNEWYENSNRRAAALESMQLRYLGMGVSGGEEGARFGPSLMPGGDITAYEHIYPILSKIAAQVEEGPCVSYIGPGGAGHYVKMVHNGIEYAEMEGIAEAYNILKTHFRLSNEELKTLFTTWNQGELQSFLIEITAQIFGCKDDHASSSGYLLDKILDTAASKGTGKWTIQEAAEHQIPCPSIAAALDSRYLSARRSERIEGARLRKIVSFSSYTENSITPEDVRQALYCSKICAYTQGLMLLHTVSSKFFWNLNLSSILRSWKGGCIIRAVILDQMASLFDQIPLLSCILLEPDFFEKIAVYSTSWRSCIALSLSHGIPVPAFAASLTYFDGLISEKLPMNLIQAQRDLFGAHTYQRIDISGTFHSEWK